MMKDSGIEWVGSIPSSWAVIPAGGLFTEIKEKNKNLKYTNPLQFKFGTIVDKAYVGDLDANMLDTLSTYTCVEPDTIMLNGLNLNYDFVSQRVGIVTKSGVITSAYLAVYPDKNRILPRYANYLLKAYDSIFVFHGMGSGVRKTLQWKDFKNLKFVLPNLGEQAAIIGTLDSLCEKADTLIANVQAQIEKLKAYKQSVITEVVTKGLDLAVPMKDSGIVWIGEIPAHWEIAKLRTRTNMLTPMRDKPEDLSGPIPWVRIEDYCGKYITASKEQLGVSAETVAAMNLKVYPVGTVLCTSSCDLGKCAIVGRELVSNQRFIGIIPQPELSADYLYYLMLSNAERLNTLSTGSIQANLSRVSFEQLLVQFPPMVEQKAISEYLDKKCEAADRLIAIKQAKIEKLEQYKRSLIYEYVTGKKEVS